MARIIDNSREVLKDVLNRELQDVSEVAIATAYFNIMGFSDIENGLNGKPLHLLLGRPPEESIKWEDEILRELEEYEDDPQYFKLLKRTIDYFEDQSRQVRIVEGRFFHGKAFMGAHPSLADIKRGFAIVGSSNFTHGGMTTNHELNMFNTDRETVKELVEWFQCQWRNSKDYKEEFLFKLKSYITSWSPYEVVAKALWETYKKDLERREESVLKDLLPHQQLSFIDALDKLKKYNGVIIADSTGLGKTRTALALIHYYRREGVKALLIAPKSILKATWCDEMRDTDILVESINTEKLSADPSIVDEYINEKSPGMVVVDEAHFFRHPATNRYSALSKLLTATKAKVVLITATPVNTSLMDLYHLLSLYLQDDAIYEEYGKTLREYFIENQKKWLDKKPIDMDDFLSKFIVRHSRKLAAALSKLKFPTRRLHTTKYNLAVNIGELCKILDELNFAFYDLAIEKLSSEFKLPNGTPVSKYPEQVENLKRLVKQIQKINLLKRLESSLYAFKISIERLKQYIEYANICAQQQSVFIPPRLKGELFRLIDNEEEPNELPSKEIFSKEQLLLNKCSLLPNEVNDFIQNNNEDLNRLNRILEMLPSNDHKLERLLEEIREIYPTLKDKNGIIIFTVYVDTAKYLYKHIKERFERVMIVTGEGAEKASGDPLEEAEAVKWFTKNGGIMVSTDVLSAGHNLQNAQYVINYDFPWNPVVLIQRAGRVDRIGSPYGTVYLYNVLPQKGSPDDPTTLEYFLNLISRLYERLEGIRETIGLDASNLGEEVVQKDFSKQLSEQFSEQFRIADEDNTILDELEKRIEQFTRDPLDDLAWIINKEGYKWIKQLPDGIGAMKMLGRDGIFALYTDGQKYYWRLKWLDNNKTVDNPNEIVATLLSGEVHNKGEIINYDSLVKTLKQLKEELSETLEKRRKVSVTIDGVPVQTNKDIREIFCALEKMGDMEMAARFRENSNRPQIVKELKKALAEGRLLQEARKLLPIIQENTTEQQNKTVKLKRICWCIIT